jgi:transcriptional regulator with XRE-family HTH domain
MMSMKKTHYISPVPRTAAQLLGARVREARIGRRLSLIDLAGRVGVSENTMRKIERGDPTVGLGVTFEAATLVGVPLFDEDAPRVERELRRVNDRLILLPKAVRKVEPVNANF